MLHFEIIPVLYYGNGGINNVLSLLPENGGVCRKVFCVCVVTTVCCIRDMTVLIRPGVISHKPYAQQFT